MGEKSILFKTTGHARTRYCCSHADKRDGGLKRSAPKKEWKEQYQQEFSRRLKVQNVDTEKKEEKTE